MMIPLLSPTELLRQKPFLRSLESGECDGGKLSRIPKEIGKVRAKVKGS